MTGSGTIIAPGIGTLVCADWSSRPEKRAAWVGHVQARTIERLQGTGWDLDSLMRLASALPAPRLVAVDAVLGLPRPYLDLAREDFALSPEAGFLEWLSAAGRLGTFESEPCEGTWTPLRPFFGVPKGSGGLTRVLREAGSDLLREIDRGTGAKTVFAVRGIPGTVGAGSRALWRELAEQIELSPAPSPRRPYALWPFEGDLRQLLRERQTVLVEIYPRAAYATALADSLPAPARTLAKTKSRVRTEVVEELWEAGWVARQGVRLLDRHAAEAGEDDFDAMITTAALLRCVLEARPLFDPARVDPLVEGGILGTGTSGALPGGGEARCG